MRVFLGGGHGRGRGPRISVELGPVGSAIACAIITVIGTFVTLLALITFNFILIFIGAVFLLIGIFGFRSNIQKEF